MQPDNTNSSSEIPGVASRIQVPEPATPKADSDAYLVEIDGDMVVPTELCGGPWDEGAQHGSAVAAVLARAIEMVETPVPMRPARLTVDLLSRVPLTPMRQVVKVVKMGRQIAVVEAELHNNDRIAARASALLIRDGADLEFPAGVRVTADLLIPATEALPPPPGELFSFPGFWNAMDYMRTQGMMASGSPASAWLRLRCRVAAGEDVTPFQRLAVAADMGSGLGSFLPFARFRSINADISLHVLRLPETEWIGLDGETRVVVDGIGQSTSVLFDETGMVGRMQSSIHVSTGRPASISPESS